MWFNIVDRCTCRRTGCLLEWICCHRSAAVPHFIKTAKKKRKERT